MTFNLENNQIIIQENSIVEFDVKFLSFVNKHGRMEYSSSTGEFELLPKQKKEMFFMQTSLCDRMSRDFDNDLGKVNYSLVEREYLKFISIPLDCGILFAVLPIHTNHYAFVRVLKTILNNSKRNSKKQDGESF